VRGATLPQAWQGLVVSLGIFWICLLATGRPSTSTEGIPEVVRVAPADLIRMLAKGFADIERFTAVLFVHDGRAGTASPPKATTRRPAASATTTHGPTSRCSAASTTAPASMPSRLRIGFRRSTTLTCRVSSSPPS
jgi:hypothetical protein